MEGIEGLFFVLTQKKLASIMFFAWVLVVATITASYILSDNIVLFLSICPPFIGIQFIVIYTFIVKYEGRHGKKKLDETIQMKASDIAKAFDFK